MTLQAYKRRKERQNVSAFAALIATPAAASVTLPAPGRFRVVATAGAVADQLACTLTSTSTREIQTPLLAAGGYVALDWLERGVVITLEAGFELWVNTGLDKYAQIAGA